MSPPRLVDERGATNGEHHLLERCYHHGPNTLRVRVTRDMHSATRSNAVTQRLTTSHGWTVLADLPAQTEMTPPPRAPWPPCRTS